MASLYRTFHLKICRSLFYINSPLNTLSSQTFSFTHKSPSSTHNTPFTAHPLTCFTSTYTTHNASYVFLIHYSSTLIHKKQFSTHTSTLTHHTPSPTQYPLSPLPLHYTTSGSVYVHYPYCRQRCSYCNFVKFIPRPNSLWSLGAAVLEDALVRRCSCVCVHSITWFICLIILSCFYVCFCLTVLSFYGYSCSICYPDFSKLSFIILL